LTTNDESFSEPINQMSTESTVILQSEYVPLTRGSKVIVFAPSLATVVLEEHNPPYVIDPAILEENV